MNTTAEPLEQTPLPELADETIVRLERDLFEEIDRERAATTARSARRRRTTWIASGAAAAVIVVAAVIAPSLQGIVAGGAGSDARDLGGAPVPAVDGGGIVAPESGEMAATDADVGATARDVIATASATLRVEDASAAAESIAADATARGGYVESMTLAGSEVVARDGGVAPDMMPYYPTGDWITVRVPADELTDTIAGLSELGEVEASAVNRQDVTEQTVDLRARIDAAEASVERLTTLMSQAENVADLLAAEQALAERQALLESYQQQLTMLESQVALSSLTVSLVEPVEPVSADPAGFGDGIAAGWNGLVATLNGIVVALGFLLPWLAVAAVAALIVWGIRRLVKSRRTPREPSE